MKNDEVFGKDYFRNYCGYEQSYRATKSEHLFDVLDMLRAIQRLTKEPFRDIVLALQGMRALDVGCGFGHVVADFVSHGMDGHGIEISKYALSHITPEVIPTRIHECDLALYPESAGEPFGLVYCNCLQYATSPAVLRDWLRCLWKLTAGALVLALPYAEQEWCDAGRFGMLRIFSMREFQRHDGSPCYLQLPISTWRKEIGAVFSGKKMSFDPNLLVVVMKSNKFSP